MKVFILEMPNRANLTESFSFTTIIAPVYTSRSRALERLIENPFLNIRRGAQFKLSTFELKGDYFEPIKVERITPRQAEKELEGA